MKQGGFASIIKAQEQDLGFFLPQTKWCQHPIKPINQKHYFSKKKRTFKASSFDLLTKTEREREQAEIWRVCEFTWRHRLCFVCNCVSSNLVLEDSKIFTLKPIV